MAWVRVGSVRVVESLGIIGGIKWKKTHTKYLITVLIK